MAQQIYEQSSPVQSSQFLPADVSPLAAQSAGAATARHGDVVVEDSVCGERQAQTRHSAFGIARLCRKGRRYLLLHRLLRTTFFALAGAAALYIGVLWYFRVYSPLFAYHELPILRAAPALLLAFSLTGLYLSTQGTRTAAAIAEAGDVSAIGTLLDLLARGDENRLILTAALTRLLPRLQASDALVLTRAQRACLLRELSRSALRKRPRRTQSFYATAILKALEQIGDADALPLVCKVADASEKRTLPAVREAAGACLPYLQERIARRQANETLLRAAHAAQDAPEILLRPVASHVAESPGTLLCATAARNSGEERP